MTSAGTAAPRAEIAASRDRSLAMRLSLATGAAMLAGKAGAYWMTGSAAILSDAAESVIHIAAVSFAALSLHLVSRPPRNDSPYGYDKMAFLSAGFEGGMIIVAAVWIIAAAAEKWRRGLVLDQLSLGVLIVLAAAVLNLALGLYLISTGRRTRSLILEANGQHVLTDSWTSFGVVAGLLLVLLTGWKPFDPLCAIAVALNILRSGGALVLRSFRGLMDLPDTVRGAELREAVDRVAGQLQIQYHRLRFRDTGKHVIGSIHLLLPSATPLGEAHRLATRFEERLAAALPYEVELLTHLESLDDHATIHPHESSSWH